MDNDSIWKNIKKGDLLLGKYLVLKITHKGKYKDVDLKDLNGNIICRTFKN